MTLSRLYKKTTLYPAIIGVIGTSVVSVYENKDYKSEWITPELATVMGIIAGVVYSLIVSALCLGIFLNGIKEVRDNFLWSLLSWFLLPYGWMILAIVKTLSAPSPSNVGYLFLIILNTPFIISLAWTFILFRKNYNT